MSFKRWNLFPILSLMVCMMGTSSNAANDVTLGSCSYLHSKGSLTNLKLISEGVCTKYNNSGTGFWVQRYEWENGNSFVYIMDDGDETLNGQPILETGQTNARNSCWITKDGNGFGVSCFEPVGYPKPL